MDAERGKSILEYEMDKATDLDGFMTVSNTTILENKRFQSSNGKVLADKDDLYESKRQLSR